MLQPSDLSKYEAVFHQGQKSTPTQRKIWLREIENKIHVDCVNGESKSNWNIPWWMSLKDQINLVSLLKEKGYETEISKKQIVITF